MVSLLKRACEVSESVQSHLDIELGSKLAEASNSARNSVFRFQSYLDGESALPYAKVLVVLSGTGLCEKAMRGVPGYFQAIEDINGDIHDLTQEILRLAPRTRSLWMVRKQHIKHEVNKIHNCVNMYMQEAEKLAIEIMGDDDFYASGLMFAMQGLFAYTDEGNEGGPL